MRRHVPPLFPNYGDGNLSPVRRPAVFEKKNSLPGAELHLSIDDRDYFARARKDHSNMRRHIVPAFIVVLEIRRIFRHETIEKFLEVAARFRRGIFHDDETATRVAREDDGRSVFDPAFIHYLSNVVGNFVRSFAASRNFKAFRVNRHLRKRATYAPRDAAQSSCLRSRRGETLVAGPKCARMIVNEAMRDRAARAGNRAFLSAR
jgi:hypothetical protein